MKKGKPIVTDMLNEARRDMTDVIEEIGAARGQQPEVSMTHSMPSTGQSRKSTRCAIVRAGGLYGPMDWILRTPNAPTPVRCRDWLDLSNLMNKTMKTGAQLISEERARQISEEGWDASNDTQYMGTDDLAMAAVCYALPKDKQHLVDDECLWPWSLEWWKPGDRLRNLAKAGALIAAQIDLLQRGGVASANRDADGWCLWDWRGTLIEEWPQGWPAEVDKAWLEGMGIKVEV